MTNFLIRAIIFEHWLLKNILRLVLYNLHVQMYAKLFGQAAEYFSGIGVRNQLIRCILHLHPVQPSLQFSQAGLSNRGGHLVGQAIYQIFMVCVVHMHTIYIDAFLAGLHQCRFRTNSNKGIQCSENESISPLSFIVNP